MCHLILLMPVFALPVFWLFPFSIALPIYLIISGISALLYYLIFKAMTMTPRVGKEAMLGQTAEVIKEIAPEGKIKYFTEIWNAAADGKKFSVGEKVMIYGFWGITVLVKEIPVETPRKQNGNFSYHYADHRKSDYLDTGVVATPSSGDRRQPNCGICRGKGHIIIPLGELLNHQSVI